MRINLTLLALLFGSLAFAQIPGSILDPAVPAINPMNPNGDAFVTSTNVAFVGPLDEAQFELPYLPVQQYQPEPSDDNQFKPGCEFYDLVNDATNGADAGYYYYQDPDNIPDNGDELIFFRFRVARFSNGVTGFSILMDTDFLFGFTGPEADPNALTGNPGFEREIALYNNTGVPGGVWIFNVDGMDTATVATYFASNTSNYQVAYALNQDPACTTYRPVFVDIYMPFSALGISASTQVRMVVAVNEAINSCLGGGASDIGGVNGNLIADDDDQFIAAVTNYSPIAIGNNANKAPVPIDASLTLIENTIDGTPVHTVTALDPNGDALTYSITGGNVGSAFAVNSSTGEITVSNSSALDAEITSTFILVVRVSDGNLYDNAIITVNLDDVNEHAPLASDAVVNLNENSVNGTLVHAIGATDADVTAVLTYSIIAGNSDAFFAINTSTGQLTVNDSGGLDYEATSSFILTVRVSDGSYSDDASIAINLNDVNEPPSTTNAALSISENTPNGTLVHTMTATDPDAVAVLTYSIIGGNTGSAFALNGSSGAITVNNFLVLDYETTPLFTLTVRVSDGTLSQEAIITINLTNVNEAPVGTDAIVTINENTANGLAVHMVAGADPDASAILNYSIISGNTGGAFAINSGTGAITVNNSAAMDYETTPSFALTVRISDGVLFDDASITINLNNVNEAPVAADATLAVNENIPNGTLVHTVAATDPDAMAVLTYSIIAGNMGTAFAVNSSSGAITVNNSSVLDYETTPAFVLTMRVSDGNLSHNATITVELKNVNDAPVGIDATVNINENTANGLAVHTVAGADQDASAVLDYSIIAGNTSAAFTINPATGAITVDNSGAMDYETTPSFVLTIRISDGVLFDDASITINLNNVNEAPVATDASVTVNENAPSGTLVHTMIATDPDAQAVLTYSIVAGNKETAFAINDSGEITVSNSLALDFETTSLFTLTVRVSDENFVDDGIITINLKDTNEPPSCADATVALNENTGNGIPFHILAGSDPDAGTILTYSITGGNPGMAFAIDMSTGAITVNNPGALDFEVTPVFDLIVRVSDGSLSSEARLRINLMNVNEPPQVVGESTTVERRLIDHDVVYTVAAEDPDADDVLAFSITGGNVERLFTVHPQTGEITIVNVSGLSDEPSTFDLQVTATDAGGLSGSGLINITLIRIPDRADIIPQKGFSPNGDGNNEFWLIKGIEAFPENSIKVFNRWGVTVYEAEGYNNETQVWRGEANGKIQEIENTYFFVIKTNDFEPITGYVIVKP